MLRRRGRRKPPREPERAFARVLREVEVAKEALVAAVPSARRPGHPLAEALFEFERRLGAAAAGMPAWRHDSVEEYWMGCRGAIEEARRRAELLRLEAPDLGFEALLARISELLDPLEPFEEAAGRFEELGGSLR